MHRGFHLIELMIVVGIISLLTVIAIPLYSQYMVKAKRLTAEATLMKMAAALERYFILHNRYEGATLSRLGFSKEEVRQYEFKLHLTASGYQIKAIPKDDQAEKDAACGTLSLDSRGTKS